MLTLSNVEQLRASPQEADETLQMDEDAFRGFYERTARGLWSYLSRVTGDMQLADDLLQETYYRFLRADAPYESEAHRRHYLFRIATNLAKDCRRRRIHHVVLPDETGPAALRTSEDVAQRAERRVDLTRAMAKLKQRERSLLWLAYAHGSSHQEIAEMLGLRRGSIKLLLFRARRKLAKLLRAASPAEAGHHR